MKVTELEFKSVFAQYIRDFLEFKISLGYKYRIEGYMLRQFDRFCVFNQIVEPILSGKVIEDWIATKPNDAAPTRGSRRTC